MLKLLLRVFVIIVVVAVTGGCNRSANPPVGAPSTPTGGAAQTTQPVVALPEFGASQTLRPGIKFQEATVQRAGVPMKVWFYEPEQAAKGKRALVLVPPAGSTLFAGMNLGEGDREEHWPYVLAGFAVASFEIDGFVGDNKSQQEIMRGARQFKDSQAGVANTKTALDLVLAKIPDIDSERVYIAGHSSAATLALLAASLEPRIKACAAYAPATDVELRVAKAIAPLDQNIPGYRDFLHFSSPKTHVAELKCPVFLFHASDDANIPIATTIAFAETLKTTNPNVTLVTAKSGGHYQSMIREGIPKGIAWLQGLAKGKGIEAP